MQDRWHSPVPMRMTTVRLSEPLYNELQRAAEAGGVSVAQWLREAAIAQLSFEKGEKYARYEAQSDPTSRRKSRGGDLED
jgi:Ribbon-helix-helix protein, copG family